MLTVVVIITIMVAVGEPAYMSARNKARENKKSAIISSVASAKEIAKMTMAPADQTSFNAGDNTTRFSTLTAAGLLVIQGNSTISMTDLCKGTGKPEVQVGDLNQKPYFD